MNPTWPAWSRLDKPVGWSHLQQIAVGKNLDGRQEVFAIDTDGALWHIWQTAANNGWSHWESRGKPTVEGIELTSPPVGKSLAVGRHQDGRLLVCVVAAREAWLLSQSAPNNGWGQWQPLGHPQRSGGVVSLAVAQNHDRRLQVFAVTYGNRLASREETAPNGDWREWDTAFPHTDDFPFKSFAIGQNADGRLELVANLSGILALVTQGEPGRPFRSGFGNAGGPNVSDSATVTMARNADGTLEAATTIDGRLVHLRQHVPNQLPSPGGSGWVHHNLDQPAEHVAVRHPVLGTNRDGRLDVFVRGSDSNLWHREQAVPSGEWNQWQSLGSPLDSGAGEVFAASTVGINQDGRLEVFVLHRGELWHTWQAG